MQASITQVSAPLGQWTTILEANPARRLLMIQQVDTGDGLRDVRLSMSGQNPASLWQLDGVFAPVIAPSNAVYAFVADMPSEFDSNNVIIQVIEG